MILIVDYNGGFAYSLYQSLIAHYASVEVIDHRKLKVEDIEHLRPDAIILSSGPGLPSKQILDIVKTYAPRIPMLGISYGMLAIGSCFGAQIVHVSEVEHGKSTLVHYEQDNFFEGIPNPFEAGIFHTHILSHRHFPKDLKILAETPKNNIMCVKHAKYPCYGVQFYPDSLLTPQGDQILANFAHLVSQNAAARV